MLSKIFKILICFACSLIIYGCNNSKEMNIHNENGLSGHLQEIVDCFVEQYKIPKGSNIYISEGYFTKHSKPFFPTMNINKHVYIVMIEYADDIPKISDNRVLYSTKLNSYTLFYALDKDKEMSISNNLVWKKVEQSKEEKSEEIPVIVDYLETQFVYNKEENVIELSDFRSESCKGRLNDEYEW